MLKGLTNTFKNNCNATEVVLSEYLVLGNQTIPIKAELSDDCYENGNFIGTFILKSIKFQTDATYNFKNKEFEYYKVVNGESIKIGTFITTEVTISDTNELVSVVGMDYGLKTQVQYTSSLDYASGTITLLDVWNEACTLSSLESGITNFPNSDFIVDSDQFTGTGATIRDVFKGIAMSSGTFVKVMNDDKIYLVFTEYTSENKNLEVNGSTTIQDGLKLDSIELQGNTSQNGTPTPDNPVDVEVVTGTQTIIVSNGTDSNTYEIDLGTIELCKIDDYQDKIYKSNGTWYLEKNVGKIVLDGTESWSKMNWSGKNAYRTKITNLKITTGGNQSGYLRSDRFQLYTTNGLFNLEVPAYGICHRTSQNEIIIRYDGYTSASNFKSWLEDHNTTVYYAMETPVIEEITDTALINQLEYVELLDGVNNISISSNDLPVPLELTYYNNELDIIEDYTELEDKRDTHPWTCLRLGMSQIDGENVDYIDQELVEEYGENWLILNDNPFAYNQTKRQQLITAIFNQIKAFGYSAFSSKTSFKPYLTCGDVIQFKNRDGNLVSSIVLRYNHNYEDITIEAPSETSATINYVYPLSAIDIAKRTQLEVDKEKGQITSLVENVGILQTSTSQNADNINRLTSMVNSQGENIEALGTRITQTAENITASVSAIQQEIDNGVGLVKTTSVTIDNSGLNVSTDTSKISTTMTNNSFQIKDNSDKTLAFFGYDEQEGISKAEMDNLTVTNYFIAGVHRIEKMEVNGEKRTGHFYIGG